MSGNTGIKKMKSLLTILFCLGLPVMGADKKPLTKEQLAKVIEAANRKSLNKPEGELTKAQIAQLQKALPKCRIISNPKK